MSLLDLDGVEDKVIPAHGLMQDAPGRRMPYGTSGRRNRLRRLTGVFHCDVGECTKQFSRADHLQRHKLNHNPLMVYRCEWKGCGREFVRKDLRTRHMKRHMLRQERELLGVSTGTNTVLDMGAISDEDDHGNDGPAPRFVIPIMLAVELLPGVIDLPTSIDNIEDEVPKASAMPPPPPPQSLRLKAPLAPPPEQPKDIMLWLFSGTPNNALSATTPAMGYEDWGVLDENLTVMLEELLNIDKPLALHLASAVLAELVDALVALVPSLGQLLVFTPDAVDVFLDAYWTVFHQQYPIVHRPSFDAAEAPKPLVLALIMTGAAWVQCSNHNPQNITMEAAHEVSMAIAEPLRWMLFLSESFHPPALPWIIQSLLVLELFEKLCGTRRLHERGHLHHGTTIQLLKRLPVLQGHEARKARKNQAKRIKAMVAPTTPLAGQPDMDPPQLLLLDNSISLMVYREPGSDNNVLKPMLYNSISPLVLRTPEGSPNSNGSPARVDLPGSPAVESDGNDPVAVWKRWIEAESMKRCAFLAFCIDNTHAVEFEHQLTLFAHQMHLTLPCDEAVWELLDLQLVDRDAKQPTPLFLAALRLLLNKRCVNTTGFGKRILLAGLQLVAYQLLQRDLQVLFFGWDLLKDTWKDTLTLAFDVWRTDMCGGGCCALVLLLVTSEDPMVPYYSLAYPLCKCAYYHMLHSFIRTDQYAYNMYAGAPWRMLIEMERDGELLQYRAIERRVKEWAALAELRIAVMHCYMVLWEHFLTPMDVATPDSRILYHPDLDPFMGGYAVATAMLVVWNYNYALSGPESTAMRHSKDPGIVGAAEDGYAYLERVRRELVERTGTVLHYHNPQGALPVGEDGQPVALTGHRFYMAVQNAALLLLLIPDKHQVAGLCKLVLDSLQVARWQLLQEHSRLIRHCGRRSLGVTKVKCSKMYVSESMNE